MRRWTRSLKVAGALVACIAIGGAGSAAAATLSYTGTLTFEISTLPSASTAGAGVYVGPLHISTIGFNAGQFGPLTTSVPMTSSWTINSIVFTGMANTSGVFTGLSGGSPGGGSMGLSGVAKVCLTFAACQYSNVTVPLTPDTAGAGFGVGGTQLFPQPVPLTLQHAPWTVGQPVMTIHTPNSSTTSPALPGGYASPPSATAANSGVLQLVTATKVFTNLTGAFPELPMFSILNLHFFGGPTPTPTPTPSPTPHGIPTPQPHGTPTSTPWAHGTPTSTPGPHGTPTPTPLPVGDVTLEWVTVGDPGNACDPQEQGCFGSVAYTYRIGKYEVTNAQYAEFLNAVAATDTYGLYSTSMGFTYGGITRSGSSGSYSYSVKAGWADKPVGFTSFYDALRFANWLHNGQPNGPQDDSTTEDGAYTITPAGIAANSITRNAWATVFLTSEDEWYKAAYYDAASTSHFDYPSGTDTLTTCSAPGPTANTANCFYSVGDLTDVGSYTGSSSPYGTFDQGGNVNEMNEAIIGSDRTTRGGNYGSASVTLAVFNRYSNDPTTEFFWRGFRVASIPEAESAE